MSVFLVLGLAGLVLVAASLVLGDIHSGALEALEADWFSSAVIGGFVSAFGFGGAAADAAGAPWPVAVLVGLVTGALVAWFAWWLTRLVKDGGSDDTPTVGDSVGRTGRVVTAIPGQGFGVVRIAVGGHVVQCNASALIEIPAGTEVTVTGVLSPTAVTVTPVWKPEN